MTQPYEFLARFNPNGTVAGASIRNIDAGIVTDPLPVDDAADTVAEFAKAFAAKAVEERDAALTTIEERDASIIERDEATTNAVAERDEAIATIAERDATIAERDEAIVKLESERDEANAKVDELTDAVSVISAERDEAKAHSADLETQIDQVLTHAGSRRYITPQAFQSRFSADLQLAMMASTDQNIIAQASAIAALRDAEKLIHLDHPSLVAGIGYMLQIEMIDEAAQASILRDSTASERT